MAYYSYICKLDGEITLDLRLGEAHDKEICPKCGQEMSRSYSPIANVWKVVGNYGKSSK